MRNAVLAAAAAAAVLAGLAPPAVAQTAADRSDARCMILMQAVTNDPKRREAATRGVYFFLGRLAARGPIARLQSLLPAEAAAMRSQGQAQLELTRCGQELSKSTGDFQAIAQKLAQAARPATPAPAPKLK